MRHELGFALGRFGLLLLFKLLKSFQPLEHLLVRHGRGDRGARGFIILETTYVRTIAIELVASRGRSVSAVLVACATSTSFVSATVRESASASSRLRIPVAALLVNKADFTTSVLLLEMAERLRDSCLGLSASELLLVGQ